MHDTLTNVYIYILPDTYKLVTRHFVRKWIDGNKE